MDENNDLDNLIEGFAASQRRWKKIDARPKYIKVMHKIWEGLAYASGLACLVGMVDSIQTRFFNLSPLDFFPVAATGVVTGLLAVQTSRSYWNDEPIERYEDFVKRLNRRR